MITHNNNTTSILINIGYGQLPTAYRVSTVQLDGILAYSQIKRVAILESILPSGETLYILGKRMSQGHSDANSLKLVVVKYGVQIYYSY